MKYILSIFLVITAALCFGQTEIMREGSFSGGGAQASSDTYRLHGSFGQSASGNTSSASFALRATLVNTPPETLFDGLIAYYLFNSNANDESGNGNNGTNSGATITTDRFGNADAAYGFDGNDEISASFILPTSNLTVSVWARANTLSADATIINLSTNFGNDSWIKYNATDGFFEGHYDNRSGGGLEYNIQTDAEFNEWNHYVLHRNGTNLSFYVNGKPITISIGDFTTDHIELFIGSLDGQQYFEGSIDDIRIYNRALSEAEILELYAENDWLQTSTSSFITTWQTNADGESVTIPTTGTGYSYSVDWGDGTIETVTGDASHTYATAGTYTVAISGDFPQIYFNSAGDTDKIQTIEQWGNIAWTSMNNAFAGCTNLTYNASDAPNLSAVTDFSHMFLNCSSFSGDLSSWDVSTATNMNGMFLASAFNGNVNTWNVSQVTDMADMFNNTPFNGDVSTWDVSSVLRMDGMLAVGSFNSDVSNWNVSNVQNMERLFDGASVFDQNLSSWDISSVTSMTGMFDNSGMSTDNYDATLKGWASLEAGEAQIPTNITLGATGLNYCSGQAARDQLINAQSWTINGDSKLCTISDGLLAYYLFNGNAVDESAKGNDGIEQGTVGISYTDDRFNEANAAAVFTDGGYIDANLDADLDTLTVSFWINTGTLLDGKRHTLIDFQSDLGNLHISEIGELVYEYSDGVQVVTPRITETNAVALGQWEMIALSVDESNVLRIYVNSELILQETLADLGTNRSNSIRLSRSTTGATNVPYEGELDDFRLYNRVLSADEISDVFESERVIGSESNISEFTIDGQVSSEIIDTESRIIVVMPHGTDLTSLKPTITISDFASISPDTTQTQDFTNSVTYTVTSEDTNSVTVWDVFVYALPVVSDGLVGYYPFDGNANDESGNKNDLALADNLTTASFPSLTSDRNGIENQAYSFDGVDDFISGDFVPSITNFTIGAWIYLRSDQGTKAVVELISPIQQGFQLEVLNDKLYFVKTNDSNTEVSASGENSAIPLDEWVYVSAINEGIEVSFYINGELTDTFTNTNDVRTDIDRLIIGGADGGADPFNGNIDDVRIFNRALSTSEIQEIYEAEKPLVLSEGLVAYYEFNNNANNAISSDFNGTLIGGVTSTMDRNGNEEQAYNFDGVQGTTINLANSQDMFAGDIFTVSLWVNPQTGGASNTQFIVGNQVQILYFADNNTVDFQVVPETGSISVPSSSTKAPSDQWTHITVSYDDAILKKYINGVLDASEDGFPGIDLVTNSQNVTLGSQGDIDSNGTNFKGDIDDLRIYNVALTDAQVLEIYEAEKPEDSTEALITSFTIPDQVGETVIDNDAETVEVVMPANTDITGLTPTIEVSSGATVVPESVLAQDFTNPVTYTVTAQDGVTTKSYVATVTTLSQGLVAYYPFDGNANDQSDNGYDMSLQGNTQLAIDRFGNADRCYLVDGTGDYLSNSDFDITNQWTVALWMNPEADPGMLVAQYREGSPPINALSFGVNGNLGLEVFSDGASNTLFASVDNQFALNSWKHAAVSYDGSEVRFYVDGALVSQQTASREFQDVTGSNIPVTIGAGEGGSQAFTGRIDEVRIYDFALSDEVLAAIYTSEAPTPNSPPSDITLSNNEIVDGSASGTAVGVFSTTDADDGDVHIYSLVSGTGDTDNGSFSLTQAGELSTNFTADFASKSSYSILVQTDDSREEGTYSEQFTITVVQPTGQKPTAINFSASDPITISEIADIGTIIGTFSTVDPDDPDGNDAYIYSIVSGNTSVFEIDGSDLVTIDFLDFEAVQSYDLTIRTRDPGNQELDSLFTINVSNENETPFINDFAGSVVENANMGTVVGTIFGGDLDGETTLSFTLLDNTETFELDTQDGTSTRLVVLDNTALDFEAQQAIDFQIRVSDAGGLDSTRTFTVEIQNANPQPSDLVLSNTKIPEGLDGGNIVGALEVIGPEGGRATYSYSIVSGDDSNFTIEDNQLEVTNGIAAGTYSVTINASDDSGNDTVTRSFEISVFTPNASGVLSFGRSVSDYRIIGIPSASAQVGSVFTDLEEEERKTSWRIVSWANGSFTDLSRSSNMTGGKGYWMLSEREVLLDQIFLLPPISADEYTITLSPDWNLIANPYLDAIDINDAISLSIQDGLLQASDLSELFAYNENVITSLGILQGGWIRNNSGSTISLKIPNPNRASSGRSVGDKPDVLSSWYEDDANWQLLLEMHSDKRVSNSGAVGMRTFSSDQKDDFDLTGPPLISEELAFRITDEFGLARNFKSPGSDQVWSYDVLASGHTTVTLSWDLEVVNQLPEQLYLYVPRHHTSINMSAISSLEIPANARFQVILGDQIDRSTLQIPVIAYPNPAANHLSVRFHVEGELSEYSVKLTIFNVDGKEVISSQQEFVSNALGLFQLDDLGLAAGTYFYHVSYDGRISQMQKLIVK